MPYDSKRYNYDSVCNHPYGVPLPGLIYLRDTHDIVNPDDFRPGIRHYFTRASIWHSRDTKRYAAYDFVRHIFHDSSTRFSIPQYPGVTASEEMIEIDEDYYVPRRESAPFPPQWQRGPRPLPIFVNFEKDVFYFSNMDFPCARRHPRLEDSMLRASRSLRHRVDVVTIQRYFRWIEKIEKVAIQSTTLYTSRRSFLMSQSVRTSLFSMRNLRKIYLVVPRDPECYYGPHRNWLHAQPNEDGFLPYEDFVQLHDNLQESPDGGRECRCWTDRNPTNDELARTRHAFAGFRNPPEIMVVIEDLLR
ncbi:hypothetical protein MGN70_011483 [Eutypa lata]|nr:hypothetical protein MGN70_011483 [Eutypa lata]